jgi:cytochrome P450
MSVPSQNSAHVEAGRNAPVRRGLPVIGLLPQLRRDVLAVLQAASREQGDFVRLALPGRRPVLLLGHPDYVRHILQDNHANYRRTPFHDKLRPVLGEGLVTSEDTLWRRQRRLIQPAFQSKRIRAFVPLMATATAEMAERWRRMAPANGGFDLAAEMSNLTLAVIVRAMFRQNERFDGIGDAIQIVQEHLSDRFWSLVGWTEHLPTPANRRYRRALATLDAAVNGIVEGRSEATGQGHDLLEMLLSARDDATGAGMDRRQVRDEVMTMFLAGHETSAAGLAWAWYLLARHAEIVQGIRDECRAVLAGRRPEWADVERLAFTRMVVQEALRLFPPVPWFSRLAAAADVIDGYDVPAGSILLVSPFVLQRDARFWDEPERFAPERFAPNRPPRPTYAYFPFGGGPRTCIGNHFAMVEMTVILAMLIPLFDVRLEVQAPVPMQALVTLRPAGGLPVRVTPLV